MTNSIPKEQLAEWLGNPVTQKVMNTLKKLRLDYQQILCEGGTLRANSVEETAMQTSHLLGKIAGLSTLIEIQIDLEE